MMKAVFIDINSLLYFVSHNRTFLNSIMLPVKLQHDFKLKKWGREI